MTDYDDLKALEELDGPTCDHSHYLEAIEVLTKRALAAEKEREGLRRVVQAVEAACVTLDEQADEQESRTGMMLVAVAGAYRDATATVRAAVGGPGPTPEPACPNCGHTEPHTSRRGECPICGCDAPGPTDDERPATTREVGSGPTNPLPKGADDE